MVSPEQLEKESQRVEMDNLILRSFLKSRDSDEVDRLVNNMHEELFAQVDCILCSNCCKKIVPVLNEKDIARISKFLGFSISQFKKTYLRKHAGKWSMKNTPCPFLTPEGCSIYDVRPETCKEYPYTGKKEIVSRLFNLIDNCKICPVVFEIIQRLKVIYGREFQKYKRATAPYWR